MSIKLNEYFSETCEICGYRRGDHSLLELVSCDKKLESREE